MKKFASKFLALVAMASSLTVPSGTAMAAEAATPCIGHSPTVTVSSTSDASIFRLYCAYFGRQPDQAGYAYWQNSSLTLDQKSDFFAGASEFETRYGSLSNSEFVALIYSDVLKRQAELEGSNFWTSELDDGARTRGRVMLEFSDSDEYVAKIGLPRMAPEAQPTPVDPAGPTAAEPEVQPTPATPSQLQAIAKAKSYLRFTSFSRLGLIGQLEYHKFSTADATYAVDFLDTDWNTQAVKKGNSYLDSSSFSRQGLIDQLSSPFGSEFTVAQATHAVNVINPDWNAQAAKKAASYLRFSSFSCQGLIDQLSSKYGSQFTIAQATHGAQSTGIC